MGQKQPRTVNEGEKFKSDPAQKLKCIKANVFPNLGHAQDCDKSKKKSSPQSLFILKISNFVCFFPKISDIIYELGN